MPLSIPKMNFSKFKTFRMSQIGRVTTLSMPHAVTLDVRIATNPGGQDSLHEGLLQKPLKNLMKRVHEILEMLDQHAENLHAATLDVEVSPCRT